MNGIIKRSIPLTLIWLICLGLFSLKPAWASEGNIDDTEKEAWSERAGWLDFRPEQAGAGVAVHDAYLSGYAWAENIGWIKLGSGTGPYGNTSSTDWGVNRNTDTGALSGYGWSEIAGWINFDPEGTPVIELATGSFDGYAWSENAGWIHFKNTSPAYNVVVAAPTIDSFSPRSGSPGTPVTITGTNFVGTEVKFGGTDAASFTVESEGQITAVVGCCCDGLIEVKTAGLTGTSDLTFDLTDGAILARSTPSCYKVTVTKVEMGNDTSWVTIFSGAAELDLKSGGTFPGISGLSLPAGRYSRVRVTFRNSLPVEGVVNYGTDYYTTNTTFFEQSNLACCPTTDQGNKAEFTFCNTDWGNFNETFEQPFPINPVWVGPTTDYQPTLRFGISDTLLLRGTADERSTYCMRLSAPTVSLVEP